MNLRTLKIGAFFAISILLLGYSFHLGHTTKLDKAEIKVLFSPRGGCTPEIVNCLKKAKQTILVQAYSFTSVPIAQALKEAHDRGVKVQIILDDSNLNDKYTSATFCDHAGIATYIDSEHSIAHNKIIIIDNAIVITGSFNFSKAAEESNAENLLVIRNPSTVASYTKNWDHHLTHSVKYHRK